MAKDKPKHIMVVNDTQEILELFCQILHDEGGYEVTLTSFEPLMIDLVKKVQPDLIISDHMFGEDKFGWQFVQLLKMDRDTMHIPVIVCSGALRELRELEGYLQSKDVAVLFKPFDVDELLNMVAKRLDDARVPGIHTGNDFTGPAGDQEPSAVGGKAQQPNK